MSTCSRLDVQTLGSQPITPKNIPDHWSWREVQILVYIKLNVFGNLNVAIDQGGRFTDFYCALLEGRWALSGYYSWSDP